MAVPETEAQAEGANRGAARGPPRPGWGVSTSCTVVPMEVSWWAVALPSVITATSAFLAVLAGQLFARRKDKREAQVGEFRWIVGLVSTDNAEARRIGRFLLKEAVDHPERRNSAAQAQIVAVWSAAFAPEIAEYDEGDSIEIVDDEREA